MHYFPRSCLRPGHRFMIVSGLGSYTPKTAHDHGSARRDALLPGQFGRADSVLEADLANLNAILHPPGMVCNAGWIEASAGKFSFYAEGGGPAVARVMDAIDAGRVALVRALGSGPSPC